MARALKVFTANYDGRHKIMAAATSATAFMKLVREHPLLCPIQREYISETGNDNDIEVAMSLPGELFRRLDSRNHPWEHFPKPQTC